MTRTRRIACACFAVLQRIVGYVRDELLRGDRNQTHAGNNFDYNDPKPFVLSERKRLSNLHPRIGRLESGRVQVVGCDSIRNLKI